MQKNQYFSFNWEVLTRRFLPLVSSKRCPLSSTSRAPARCSPRICSQLERWHPQTGVCCSGPSAEESRNPGRQTSRPSRWYRCPLLSPADGPLGVLWMSFSPLTRSVDLQGWVDLQPNELYPEVALTGSSYNHLWRWCQVTVEAEL